MSKSLKSYLTDTNWKERGSPTWCGEMSQSTKWPVKIQCSTSTSKGCFTWCTVILITCPSAFFLLLFLLTLYRYSFVDAVAFLLVIFDRLISPCIKLAYLALFSLFQVYTHQDTHLYQVSDPWCVYVDSSVGFTITSLLLTQMKMC